jgi:hypothetical protein
MSDITEPQQPNEPSPQLSALDRLVGTWTVTGEAEGTVRYEWMPGRFFLLQHVELTQYGQPTTGLEVIGKILDKVEPARLAEPIKVTLAAHTVRQMINQATFVRGTGATARSSPARRVSDCDRP